MGPGPSASSVHICSSVTIKKKETTVNVSLSSTTKGPGQGQRVSTINTKGSPKSPKHVCTCGDKTISNKCNQSGGKTQDKLKCLCNHGETKRQSLASIASPIKTVNIEQRHSIHSPFHSVGEYTVQGIKCTCGASPKTIPNKSVDVKTNNKPQNLSQMKSEISTSSILEPKSPTIKLTADESFDDNSKITHLSTTPMQRSPMASPRLDKNNTSATASPRAEIKQKLTININPNRLSSPIRAFEPSNRVLEKSNSLGETKPQRLLRNTRSLSPRPPVRHQHAITVSDENDVISVKLSPNDEYEDIFNQNKNKQSSSTAKKKAQSEHASPNLSEGGNFIYDDRYVNNRSTGCLIYVPSDPWLRMSDEDLPKGKLNKKKTGKRALEGKSQSRPNITNIVDDDPWIWKGKSESKDENKKEKGKTVLYRQSKSLTTKDNEEKPQLKLCQIQSQKSESPMSSKIENRPKLQRSKSPMPYDYDEAFGNQPELKKSSKNGHKSSPITTTPASTSVMTSTSAGQQKQKDAAKQHSVIPKTSSSRITSPQHKNLTSLLPHQDIPQCSKLSNASLTVTNPNLLQPRHSFSTSPTQRDDELQLNIRRLSEQIRHTPSYIPPPPPPINYNKYTKSGNKTILDKSIITTREQLSVANIVDRRSSPTPSPDPLLETTC